MLHEQRQNAQANFTATLHGESKSRVEELDFLKCLFIVLMISFHLVYVGDGYPYVKKFVYTFHMPGFLLLSGYLTNVNKSAGQFCKTLLWYLVPYFVMEAGYVLMASALPVRDHVPNLNVVLFFDKLILHPLGPYWYLHTIVICSALCYAVFRRVKASLLSRAIMLGLAYYALSAIGLISFSCAMYFLFGVVVRNAKMNFLDVFKASWWSLPALTLLFFQPSAFNKAAVGGIMIVYFIISLSLAVFPHVPWRRLWLFLGRNSLVLYIFSPIFTICCKAFIPFLSFDPTRLLFLLLSLSVCIVGCLGLCKVLDLLHLTPFILGRKNSLV